MVLLDEHQIEETDTVIARPAASDGVLLRGAQPRNRLARIEHDDPVRGGVDTFSRTFTVTVLPINQAPTLGPISDVTVLENSTPLTVNLSAPGSPPCSPDRPPDCCE